MTISPKPPGAPAIDHTSHDTSEPTLQERGRPRTAGNHPQSRAASPLSTRGATPGANSGSRAQRSASLASRSVNAHSSHSSMALSVAPQDPAASTDTLASTPEELRQFFSANQSWLWKVCDLRSLLFQPSRQAGDPLYLRHAGSKLWPLAPEQAQRERAAIKPIVEEASVQAQAERAAVARIAAQQAQTARAARAARAEAATSAPADDAAAEVDELPEDDEPIDESLIPVTRALMNNIINRLESDEVSSVMPASDRKATLADCKTALYDLDAMENGTLGKQRMLKSLFCAALTVVPVIMMSKLVAKLPFAFVFNAAYCFRLALTFIGLMGRDTANGPPVPYMRGEISKLVGERWLYPALLTIAYGIPYGLVQHGSGHVKEAADEKLHQYWLHALLGLVTGSTFLYAVFQQPARTQWMKRTTRPLAAAEPALRQEFKDYGDACLAIAKRGQRERDTFVKDGRFELTETANSQLSSFFSLMIHTGNRLRLLAGAGVAPPEDVGPNDWVPKVPQIVMSAGVNGLVIYAVSEEIPVAMDAGFDFFVTLLAFLENLRDPTKGRQDQNDTYKGLMGTTTVSALFFGVDLAVKGLAGNRFPKGLIRHNDTTVYATALLKSLSVCFLPGMLLSALEKGVNGTSQILDKATASRLAARLQESAPVTWMLGQRTRPMPGQPLQLDARPASPEEEHRAAAELAALQGELPPDAVVAMSYELGPMLEAGAEGVMLAAGREPADDPDVQPRIEELDDEPPAAR